MQEHPEARFIVETLAKAGFVAYYAGGWVRDYLLQHPSDDIDIATNAPPETIQNLFEKTVPIGISFGIVLVIVNGKGYEVATFREDHGYEDGRRPTRIAFTTAEEDAKRRDFTINGMFYDPLKSKILDFIGGQEDLKKKIIRAIGNPHLRIQEDRLRMIRAIRLSCRFSFAIDDATQNAIRAHANELFPSVAIERVIQELEKAHLFNKLPCMLLGLHEFQLLKEIFPALLKTSTDEIKQRLQILPKIPLDAPLIANLLPLFPHFQKSDAEHLCQRLKLAKAQEKFAQLMFEAKELIQKKADAWHWARFYAKPDSFLALQSIDAEISFHENQRNSLAPFISRIQEKNPVVGSSDLIAAGIAPGKKMGELLLEAEKISINEKNENKEEILKKLNMEKR